MNIPAAPTIAVTRVGYSDITGRRLTTRDAAKLLANYTVAEVIDWATRANAYLQRCSELYAKTSQWRLVCGLCSKDMQARIRALSPRWDRMSNAAFFDDAQLLMALRLGLKHAREGIPENAARSPADFARACLILSDSIATTPRRDPKPEELLHLLLPEMFFRRQDHPRWAYARWETMLNGLRASPVAHYCEKLRRECSASLGVDISTYRAMALALQAIFHRVHIGNRIQDEPLSIQRTGFLANYELALDETRVISAFVASIEELRAAFRRAPHGARLSYYFTPLERRPVISGFGRMWCSHMPYLIERTASGIVRECLGTLRDAGDPKYAELCDSLGHLFEHYIGLLLDRAYAGRLDAHVHHIHRTGRCSGSKRADYVIQEGKTAIVLECKSHLFSHHVTAQGRTKYFREELSRMVLEGAKQVRDTIADIAAGRLILRGMNPASVRVYQPVLVTLDPVPWNPLVREECTRLIAEVALRGAPRTSGRLTILSAYDLESVEPFLLDGVQLHELIRQRNLLEVLTGQPHYLSSALAARSLRARGNSHLDAVFDRTTREAMRFWERRERRPG